MTTPYGYRLVNGKTVIYEEEAEKLRSFCRDYLSRLSFVEAGRKNGIEKSHGSLRKLTENIRYLGNDFYPAILDKETVDAIEIERKRREEALGRSHKKRRVPNARIITEFCIEKSQTKHADPYLQAEYIYSLIKPESEENR